MSLLRDLSNDLQKQKVRMMKIHPRMEMLELTRSMMRMLPMTPVGTFAAFTILTFHPGK